MEKKDLRKDKGNWAENCFCDYLVMHGFSVLRRNWRPVPGLAEVDVLAQKGQYVFLFEVKAHKWTGSGFEELISEKQKARLQVTALYLSKKYRRKIEFRLAYLYRGQWHVE